MIGAVAGLCALVVAALTYAIAIGNGRERLEAKICALLAFGISIAGVYTGQRWWADRQEGSEAARNASIDAAWQRDPVLAAFKRYDLDQYRFTQAAVDERQPELRGDPDALIFAGRHSLDTRYILGVWLKRASDDAVIAYTRALVAAATELEAKDPQLCAFYLYPPIETPVDTRAAVTSLSTATLEADTTASAEVIKSAAMQHRAPPDANRVHSVLQPILRGLNEDFGPAWQTLNRPFERGSDPALLCKVSASFYRRVVKLPPADAGEVLRHRLIPHA